MVQHRAIVIGINRYQQFQALHYAQHDAHRFRDFLVNEAGFSPQQCLLLSDRAIDQPTLQPTRENIQTYVTQICQQLLEPGDVLWLFFSGYGVRVGDRDFLLPIDADPNAIESTAVPMEALFQAFQAAPDSPIVLALDANRSQSILAGAGFGDQTASLSKTQGIAALLSAQPDQFSHETLGLRQGLFTAALIEGMRYRGCVTLDQLSRYLGDRLPELSQHHWRPCQQPLLVIPADRQHQLLVPEAAAARLAPQPEMLVSSVLDPLAAVSNPEAVASLERSLDAPAPKATLLLDPPPRTMPRRGDLPRGRAVAKPADRSNLGTGFGLPDSEQAFWRQLWLWGGLMLLALLAGVLLRNGRQLWRNPATPPAPSTPADVTSGDASISVVLSQSFNQPVLQTSPGSPLAGVQTAMVSQQFEAAKKLLDQIPPAEREPNYGQLLEQVNRGLLGEARSILNRVRVVSAQNQASDFVDAIGKARQIKPGQPYHAEAQADIDRWSQVVLDMAIGRAERRNGGSELGAASNLNAAIATARLVPTDRPRLYTDAQTAIGAWSQQILELANEAAQDGSLDLAIQTAELVPDKTPAFAPAQAAIAGWRSR